MTDIRFEPYASKLRFCSETGLSASQWAAFVATLLENVARRCEAAGNCVIGHIKTFAAIDGGGYLRASVVSARHPADLDVNLPGSLNGMTATTNVLVYGISRMDIHALMRLAIDEATAEIGVGVEMLPMGIE